MRREVAKKNDFEYYATWGVKWNEFEYNIILKCFFFKTVKWNMTDWLILHAEWWPNTSNGEYI